MTRYNSPVNHIYLIGCGGVASWLLPALVKLMRLFDNPPVIHLVDGDKLEEKNMDRQLFDAADIGAFKAEALANHYTPECAEISVGLYSHPEFMAAGAAWVEPNSLFFGCADNHPARRCILETVDQHGGRAIIGGNEYTDSEAYFYEPSFQGTELDPRKYYPELLTVTTGDPNRPAGCTGQAAEENPQLVLANYSAANHMLWLFWFHFIERPKMNAAESRPYFPLRHHNTFSRFGTELIGHKQPAPATT